jgi:hypothetical protein
MSNRIQVVTPQRAIVLPGANPARVQADRDRRRSSAATPQVHGRRRQRTRRDVRNASIREFA